MSAIIYACNKCKTINIHRKGLNEMFHLQNATGIIKGRPFTGCSILNFQLNTHHLSHPFFVTVNWQLPVVVPCAPAVQCAR